MLIALEDCKTRNAGDVIDSWLLLLSKFTYRMHLIRLALAA